MMTPKLLTYAEAGEQLGLGAQQVARIARRGEIPRVVLAPKTHRIDQADLIAFIASRKEVAR